MDSPDSSRTVKAAFSALSSLAFLPHVDSDEGDLSLVDVAGLKGRHGRALQPAPHGEGGRRVPGLEDGCSLLDRRSLGPGCGQELEWAQEAESQ